MLTLNNHTTFLPDFHSPPLQILSIARSILTLVMTRNQVRRISKQIIHLLKRQVLCFRQEEVKKQSIGEIADDEEVVVPVADIGHGCIGDLTDERVEGEGDHRGDRDALGAGAGVEYFCWDDPGEGAAGCGEGEVVEPGPMFVRKWDEVEGR